MTAIEFVKDRIRTLEALLLIKGNVRAQRVLVAWTFYGETQARPSILTSLLNSSVPVKAKANEVLADLWKAAGPIDMRRLADLADIPSSKVEKIFWRLKEAALIWPDGTLSSAAQKIVAAESNAYIGDLIAREKRAR